MTDFEIYQIGWDDGKDNNGFRPEYCDNNHYRRGFCNGAYFRAITPNKACTRPPSAERRPRLIPCNYHFLQMTCPLHSAAGNANRWLFTSRGKVA